MSDLKKNITIPVGTEKNFGYTFSLIFFLISIYAYFYNERFFLFSITIALTFFLVTCFASNYLKIPNILWYKLGLFLGHIVSFFIMFIIFYSIGTLTSIYLKVVRKDPLNKHFDKNKTTYWDTKKKQTSLKNQF
tara:strand:- start:2545 stop:2946 length:402 start_codon:yes stop_codon:yes gene_type:complete